MYYKIKTVYKILYRVENILYYDRRTCFNIVYIRPFFGTRNNTYFQNELKIDCFYDHTIFSKLWYLVLALEYGINVSDVSRTKPVLKISQLKEVVNNLRSR